MVLFQCAPAVSGEREHTDRERLKQRLGLLRKISCSPPLVYALFLLFSGSAVSLPHRVAINEGLLTTIALLATDSGDSPGISHFPQLWMHLEEHASPEHAFSEIYETTFISKRTRENPRDEDTRRLGILISELAKLSKGLHKNRKYIQTQTLPKKQIGYHTHLLLEYSSVPQDMICEVATNNGTYSSLSRDLSGSLTTAEELFERFQRERALLYQNNSLHILRKVTAYAKNPNALL